MIHWLRRGVRCDHLRVRIVGILRAWSDTERNRILDGVCEDCFSRVHRVESEEEIKTGKATDRWKVEGNGA